MLRASWTVSRRRCGSRILGTFQLIIEHGEFLNQAAATLPVVLRTMTAAGFMWIFVAFWFMLAVPNPLAWDEALLAVRFAAPTSAGILFSMLEGAGLKKTWLCHKGCKLAIFDDLDMIWFMIPLKVILMGFKWEMCIVVALPIGLLGLAWVKLHQVRTPGSWPWMMLYAVIVIACSESLCYLTKGLPMEEIHIEVCITCTPKEEELDAQELALHSDGSEGGGAQRARTRSAQRWQRRRRSSTRKGTSTWEAMPWPPWRATAVW